MYLKHFSCRHMRKEKKRKASLCCCFICLSESPEAFAQSTSMAGSKSSSSGLRLAFYPEHILWERELWSRLCDHIKQWLFVVNKARAACRGPSLTLPLSFLTLSAGSSLSTAILQLWTVRQMCATSLYIPFAFERAENRGSGSATNTIKCFECEAKRDKKPN